MADNVLHEGAIVQCAHEGDAEPMTSDERVTVSGQPIVTQTSIYSISGCTLPTPPNGNGPCVTATWVTAATRVRAGGLPVLLSSSQAQCAPTLTPLQIASTQTRVRGT